jgi:hypothetical protein
MPAAFHAISFRDTRSLLALTSFEKQELVDDAARLALRDTLVGGQLPVRLGQDTKLEIPASYLALDVLSEPPSNREAPRYPYRFKIDLASTGEVVAGDGAEKIVTEAALYSYASRAYNTTTSSLTVTFTQSLPRPPAGKLPAWIVIREHLPIPGVLDAANDKIIKFQLPSTIAANEKFLLLVQDSPIIQDEVP